MKNAALLEYLKNALDAHQHWQNIWHDFQSDPSLEIDPGRLNAAFKHLTERLNDNYPFFHPSYAGQMLKPPHPAAIIGYFAAMLINPNNHALDGGPATGKMEKEVVADIASMFGYQEFLGHLTSNGTIANLEALWISRQLHPGKAIAFSENSHYTHKRMCEVLGVRRIVIPADARGKMDVEILRMRCLSEDIGTVVATVGTTGLGALDPLPEIISLGSEFGFRVHADAAYGGFFRLLAESDDSQVDKEIFHALEMCDSIVVDPHKHGLQPYGCGCVLFRDPSVGGFYKHDSPYTYFTSDELHLGEISLECSRPGAAAAALWFTLQCLPLKSNDGLGPILRKCRNAAVHWSSLIRTSSSLYLALEPELDIETFFAAGSDFSASTISRLSDEIFTRAMRDNEPVYLSKLRVRTSFIRMWYPNINADIEWTTVLRSVLMKPEHEAYVPELHRRIERIASVALDQRDGVSSDTFE